MGGLGVCNTVQLRLTAGIPSQRIYEAGILTSKDEAKGNPYFLIRPEQGSLFQVDVVGDTYDDGNLLGQLRKNILMRRVGERPFLNGIIGWAKSGSIVTGIVFRAGDRLATTTRGGLSCYFDAGRGFKLTMGATAGGSIEPELPKMEAGRAKGIFGAMTTTAMDSVDLYMPYIWSAVNVYHFEIPNGHPLGEQTFCVVCDLNRRPDLTFMRFQSTVDRDGVTYKDAEPEFLSYEPTDDAGIRLIDAVPGGGDLKMSPNPEITPTDLTLRLGSVSFVAHRGGVVYQSAGRWDYDKEMNVWNPEADLGADFQGPRFFSLIPDLTTPDHRLSQEVI